LWKDVRKIERTGFETKEYIDTINYRNAMMQTSDYINLGIFIATSLAAIVAGLYTIFTYKMLKTMKAQYIDINKPKIHVKIETELSSSMVYLVIRNIGNGIANNVLFSIDKDFYSFSQKSDYKNLKKYPPFSKGISYMPPGDEYVYYLDQMWNFSELDTKNSDGNKKLNSCIFNISISYSYGKQDYKESYDIDLRNYLLTTKTPSRLIGELEKINSNFKKLLGKIK